MLNAEKFRKEILENSNEVCSEFYILWKSYWVWGGNFNDWDLKSYIRQHNHDRYIKDFKLKGDE